MSAHSPPIVLDYEEGVDRKTLKRLTDRFLEVNRQRWLRARSALTYRQQVVLDLLPLVFHLNHPALPGYADKDCPSGIACYEPEFLALDNLAALEEYLLRPIARFAPMVFEDTTLSDHPCFRVVCEQAEPETIQIFYRGGRRGLHLWVADEQGALVGWQCRDGNRNCVLRSLVRFLENLAERRQQPYSRLPAK